MRKKSWRVFSLFLATVMVMSSLGFAYAEEAVSIDNGDEAAWIDELEPEVEASDDVPEFNDSTPVMEDDAAEESGDLAESEEVAEDLETGQDAESQGIIVAATDHASLAGALNSSL